MLRCSSALCRQQTSWRSMLHPLAPRHRRLQWLKRDQVEMNEEVLRRPYYTIKQNSTLERDALLRSSSLTVPPSQITGPSETSVEHGGRLRPRYPETWETVPQHQPSKMQ